MRVVGYLSSRNILGSTSEYKIKLILELGFTVEELAQLYCKLLPALRHVLLVPCRMLLGYLLLYELGKERFPYIRDFI